MRSIRRVKSRVQAVLHANLVSGYAGHLFGTGGRRWLSTAPLPKAERDLLTRHLDELDWLDGKLETLDRALARISLDDGRTRKLMSIAGISSVVATSVVAASGDISRVPSPERPASYFGLTPRVRQSGDHRAIHGRISKQGNTVARTMLIEAAWSAASVPGPLRAFFLRIKDRKGGQRRGGCDGAQDRGADLAVANEGGPLSMGQASLRHDEDAQTGTAGGRPQSTRGRRDRPRLLDQGAPPTRDGSGCAG